MSFLRPTSNFSLSTHFIPFLKWNSRTFYKRLKAPCYFQSLLLADFKETILFSGFKNPLKKSANKKTRVYSWIAFIEGENEGKIQTLFWIWEDASLCPETSTKMLFKNFLSGYMYDWFFFFSQNPSLLGFILTRIELSEKRKTFSSWEGFVRYSISVTVYS
jgi:hypothetical protein